MGVAERTGWRDEALSRRHRTWGHDLWAVDLDFVLVEYGRVGVAALIEYKNEHAPLQYPGHPSYGALAWLGNQARIPVFTCRYASDFSWFRVGALNDYARARLPSHREMTEQEWVGFLYGVRGQVVPGVRDVP